jgi:hypothetical protein
MARMTPTYDKYFSIEEIRELLQLYNTPLGRKLVQTQPKLLLEVSQIGGAWGQEVAQRVMAKPELQVRVEKVLRGEIVPE